MLQDLSASVIQNRVKVLKDYLLEIFKECSKDDWDSYGALPLKQKSFVEVKKFIKAIPIWMPVPELVPEPGGDIGLEWSFGKDKILTASFSGENIITFAAILGTPKRTKYGTEIFNNSIPKEIIQILGEINPAR